MDFIKIGLVLIATSFMSDLSFGEEPAPAAAGEQVEATELPAEPQAGCVDEDGELVICSGDDELLFDEPQDDEFIPEEPILEDAVPEEP